MKQVTVYTTKKNIVPSYGDTIPMQQYVTSRDISYQAGEFFHAPSIETIHLPIQRFRWCDGREVFAGFDEELLELIGCLQEQKDSEIISNKVKLIKQHKEEIDKIKNMSSWQKIKFVLTGEFDV